MKKNGLMLLLSLLTLFAFALPAVAGPPANIPGAKAQTKAPLKNMPAIKPDLTITGMQFRQLQEPGKVEYQVKIKNLSSLPYTQGALLGVEVLTIIMIGNEQKWVEITPGKAIGPIGPGQEITVSDIIVRPANSTSFKAVVKAGNAIIETKSQKMPDMPVPDVKIAGVQCFDDHMLITVTNNSDYILSQGSGALLQCYGANGQPGQSQDWVPAGGQSITATPRSQVQIRSSHGSNSPFSQIKVMIFHSRPGANVVGDEKIIDLEPFRQDAAKPEKTMPNKIIIRQ